MGNIPSARYVYSSTVYVEREALRRKEMTRILSHYIGRNDLKEVHAYIVNAAHKKMSSKMDQFDTTYKLNEEAELYLLQEVNEHFDEYEIDENGKLWRMRRRVDENDK